VKERRYSISPNFNFLGQLVEFDTQLTNQRATDSDQSSASTSSSSSSVVVISQTSEPDTENPERAPSPSKRPCMVDLSRSVQSRGSFPVAPASVQSPTTALSRLQFVDQRQATSAAALSVPPTSTTATVEVLSSQSSMPSQSKPDSADTTTACRSQVSFRLIYQLIIHLLLRH